MVTKLNQPERTCKLGSFQLVNGQTYKVRDLIKIPTSDFEDLPDGEVMLEFDDGTIKSTIRELIHGRFLWEFYNKLPIFVASKKHHISRNKGYIDSMTDSDILNDIYWDAKDLADERGIYVDVDDACYQQYRIIDSVDSFVRRKLGRYVVSFNIKDYHDIIESPELREVTDPIDQKEHIHSLDISTIYKTINAVLTKNTKFTNTAIGMAVKSKSIKINQLYKCLGPNGYVTDVDSHIFRHPVRSSFVRGLNRLVDMSIESRTSAMSLYYQADAMRESEYLTRRLQAACSVVMRVHHGVDCGSKQYLPFTVPEHANLVDLLGKWYYDHETETEKLIESKTLDIRGKIIHLRSPLTCKIKDRGGVCEKCYGTLAKSLMIGDNIGQMAATNLQEKVSQSVLSTKHLVASANVDVFSFGEGESKFLTTKPLSSVIYLNENLEGKKIEMTISHKEAGRLQDIMFVDDLRDISALRLTKLSAVRLSIIEGDTIEHDVVIGTSTINRNAFLTTEALIYIKQNGWTVNAKGDYVIDLSKWKAETPLMDMPRLQFSMPAYMLALRDFLVNGAKTNNHGEIIHDNYHSCLAAAPTTAAGLSVFYDLVQSKLRVNLVHLEIIVLALCVENREKGDYRLPLDKSKGQLANFNDIMYNRDLSLAFAYEAQFKYVFTNIDTFTVEYRQPHPFYQLLKG